MKKTVVLNVVGLTPELLGSHMPFLTRWAAKGTLVPIQPILPAVTCAMQASYLTGKVPSEHGIVGNGWYFRDECEIKFWRQSNKLIQAPKIWDLAKTQDPTFTCANLFWWFNMYSQANISVTPRPIYCADGRKIPDCYSEPPELRDLLQKELGTFPLFNFWGPTADIQSTRWIADAAKIIAEKNPTTLTLIYLPHLDYNLQRLGPHHPNIHIDLQQIDAVCADLITFYEARDTQVIVLSEYGITDVTKPIALNRVLREHGYLKVRNELGLEILDAGRSQAFAVADHQIAHIYVNDTNQISAIRTLIEKTPGVARVFGEHEKIQNFLNHPRSGELIAIANPDAWFSYYYWLDDTTAPDFARTVDIHRKPGYDPVELFLNPKTRAIKLKIISKLIQKKLGFRYLMDVIPLDDTLVKGSHGAAPETPQQGPLFITQARQLLTTAALDTTDICSMILAHLFFKE